MIDATWGWPTTGSLHASAIGPGRWLRAVSRLVVVLVALSASTTLSVRAADDAASPAAVKKLLDAAGSDVEEGRLSAAAARLVEAGEGLRSMLEAEKPPAAARTLLARARRLREDLELQGADVEGIDLPEPPAAAASKSPARPPAAKRTKPGGPPAAGSPAAGTVVFSTQVAPLLVKHCGGCHVSARRGDFQFTSHATLLASGMIQKGAGADSRLVEVIRTGDMPRGGGKVAPQDLDLLRTWIDEGAECDTDTAAPLPGVPAAAPTPAPTPAVAVPLGPDEVSFAFQVAPVLVQHCGGCHDAMQPDGNLSMVSLDSLLRGGRNGAALVAGEGAASLLVRKLKGVDIDGQRMPLGKTPLPEEVVATIESWIDQGAKLDLLAGSTPLDTLAAAGRARRLSHDDLRAARFDAADGVWRRSIADEEATVAARGDVRVLGNVAEERLDALADVAATALADVGAVVGGRDDVPAIKGGVVVLAFAKPYDYSAFWENVLGSERPKGVVHGSGVSGDVVYAALVAPDTASPADRTEARAILVEELGAAAFLARGAPPWFASAAGRAMALRSVPKSALARGARADALERLGRLRRPASVVEGQAGAADTAAVGGAFVAAVGGGGTRLAALAARLDGGTPFDEAFAAVFQATPAAAFDAWLAKEARRGSPGR